MANRISLEAVFKAIDRFTGPIRRMATNAGVMTKAMKSSLQTVNAATGTLVTGLRRVGTTLTIVGATAGIVAQNVIGTGAGFEEAMSGVAAVMKTTVDAIGPLHDKAVQLGASTKFTATEVATAMEVMARQGRTQAEIVAGIGGVLNTAAAEGLELAQAADIVGKAMQGMGLKATDAMWNTTAVADLLTRASQSVNSDIPRIGEGLAMVAPTAKNFNISILDTVKALSLLQDIGLDSTMAGTSLAKMLNKLAAPSAATKKQLRELGVTFEDAQHNMLPFEQVLRNLVSVADQAGGNMKKSAIFTEMFGDRGIKAALGLSAALKSGRWDEVSAKIDDFAGAAGESAATRMNNLRGDTTKFTSALDGLKTKLYETEGGPLRGIVQSMTKWIETNQGLIVQKVSDWVEKFKANLPEIVKWTKRIAIGVASLYALHLATTIASGAVTIFQGVLTVCSGVVKVFSAAVRLARAAIVSETAATMASSLWTGIKTAATWALNVALKVSRLATTRVTGATIASTLATSANAIKTWICVAAQKAYAAAVVLSGKAILLATALTKGSTYALIANKVVTVVLAAKTALLAAAVWACAAAQKVYTVATGGAAAASTAMNAAAMPLLITLGAIAAAVAAIVVAYDQWKKFEKEVGGAENTLAVVGAIISGADAATVKKIVDQRMDAAARAQARAEGRSFRSGGEENDPHGMLSVPVPTGSDVGYGTRAAAGEGTSYRVEKTQAEIMVKLSPELEGRLTGKPKGKGVGVRLAPSGAF